MADYPKNREEFEKRLKKHIDLRMTRQGEYNRRILMKYSDCDFEQKILEIRHTTIEEELNPLKTMHGGIVTWLLDSTMGTLTNAWVHAPSPTMNISVNFVRGIKLGDEAIVRARLVHVGRATVSASAEILVDGKVCASAIGSFFISEGR